MNPIKELFIRIKADINSVKQAASEINNGMRQMISEVGNIVKSGLRATADSAASEIKNSMRQMISEVGNIVKSGLSNTAKQAASQISNSMRQMVSVVANTARSVLNNTTKLAAGAVYNSMRQKIGGVGNIVKPALNYIASVFVNNVKQWPSRVTSGISSLLARIRDTRKGVEDLGKTVKRTASESARSFNSMGRGLRAVILNSVIELGQKFYNFARNIVRSLGNIVKIGASIESTFNRVKAVFKDSADSVVEWAISIERGFGVNANDLLRDVAAFTSLAKGFGVAAEDAEYMAKNLALVGRDLAAFLGMDIETVMERLRSGFIGETEAIQNLGIQMEQSVLQMTAMKYGIEKKVSAMSELEKAYLRYINILDKAGDANGFFAKSINTSHTQLTLIGNTLQRIVNIIGQVFSALFSRIGKYILGILLIIEDKLKALAKMMNIDINIKGSTGQSQAEKATENIAGNLAEANKEAKKLKGSLLSIDELVTLSKKEEAGADAAGGAGVDPAILKAFRELQAQWGSGSLLDNVKQSTREWIASLFEVKGILGEIGNAFKENFIDKIREVNFDNIKTDLGSIRNSISEIGRGISSNYRDALIDISGALGSIAGDIGKVGLGIGESIIGGISIYLEENKDKIIDDFNTLTDDIRESLKSGSGIVGTLGDLAYDYYSSPSFKEAVANSIAIVYELIMEPSKLITEFISDSLAEIDEFLKNIRPKLEEYSAKSADLLKDVTGIIRTVVEDTFQSIHENYEKYVKPALTNFREGLEKIANAFLDTWNEHIYPIIKKWIEEFNRVYEKAIKPLIDSVIEFVGILIENASVIWEKFIAPLVAWMLKLVGPVFRIVFTTIGDIIGTTVQLIADVARGIIKILGGIIDFIVGVFTGDWKKAWEGLKSIVEGIWVALKSILKAPLNFLIDAINAVIRTINMIKIDVPDWVPVIGGKKFGFNIPEIPKLADGGIVTRATMALVGEAGPEAVVPLRNSSFIAEFANLIAKVLRENGAGEVTNNFNIGTLIGDEESYRELAMRIERILAREGLLSARVF